MTKKVKLAINLEDGSLKVRYTCLDTPLARKEIETALKHQGKIGLRVHGHREFISKKSPQQKLLGLNKIPAEKSLQSGAVKVPMLAVYTDYASYGDLVTPASWKRIRSQMDPRERLLFLDSALEQLEYLHGKNLVHCDIKPDNILLVEENGVARPKIIDPEQCCTPGLSAEPGGTPAYVPPEILRSAQGKYQIDFPRDIWALGFAFLGFFLERKHFPTKYYLAGLAVRGDEMRAYLHHLENISRTSLVDAGIVPKKGTMIDQNTIEYVFWKMLAIDPAKRPTAAQARKMIGAILAA